MASRVAVVGAGPAGIEASRAAVAGGAAVTLIGAELPGGRANWHSLLPSKVFLTAADMLGSLDRLENLGISHSGGQEAQLRLLVERVRTLSRVRSERTVAELAARGVAFVQGGARFNGANSLVVERGDGTSTTVETDRVILATGSVPVFPPGLKPNGKEILAPRFVGRLERLPSRMIVVGGGVTGTEFVYAFSRLGVRVSWVVDEFGVLPTFDREVVGLLLESLQGRGVDLYEGTAESVSAANDVAVTLRNGEVLHAESAFLAIGRRADLAGLGLESAGLVTASSGAILVDQYCRSGVEHIYAAGDCTGAPMCANKAMLQGFVAGTHAVGGRSRSFRSDAIVEAVYTDPQIAQVGLSEAAAMTEGRSVDVWRADYDATLKALLQGETEGFVKLVVESGTGRIIGAMAGGPHAADVLAPVAVAIGLGATREDLAAMFAAHPTLGELAFDAARRSGGLSL